MSTAAPDLNGSRPAGSPRYFYGWYIAGSGFLIQFMTGALAFHSFGAYVVLMEDEFGWSRTTFSIAFAMQRAESGVLGPLQGWLIDTYGPRIIMLIGLVLFAAGFFLLATINHVWTFYLAYLLLAVGSSLGGFLALVVSLVNWFRRRRTLALSMLSLGFAAAGLTATPMAELLETIGWRAGAVLSGFIVLVFGIPLALVVRHRPESYGLLPDGAPNIAGVAIDPDDDQEGETQMSTKEALLTPAFWFIALGQASALLVVGALMVHLVVYLEDDLGFALGIASFAITVQTGGQVAGQLLGAYAGDRLPKRPLIVAAMLGHATAIFILAFASTLPFIFAAVALNGLAWGLRAPLQTALRADYFGRRSFGTIMGFSSLVIMLGMIIGPIFAGQMYDSTGSYETSFVVLGVLAGLGGLLFLFAGPPKRPAEAAPVAGQPELTSPPREAAGVTPAASDGAGGS